MLMVPNRLLYFNIVLMTMIGESAVFELYEYSSLTFMPIDLSSIPTTVCDYLPV